MPRRHATCNHAALVATLEGADVRWSNAGDHWPGQDQQTALRRGYWVGNYRRHAWVGLRKLDVAAEAIERQAINHETGEPNIRWLRPVEVS